MPNSTPTDRKILMIEDDEQLQQSYQKLFTAEGFQVFQGFTGEQGIQLAKQEKPDIILLDIMLKGGINGFDVLERLKKDRDLFNIPVLMLTNLDSERKLALSIGAVDYLVKANTSIDVLLEKVKSYIGQSLTTFAEDTSQFGATPTGNPGDSPLATPVEIPPTTGAEGPASVPSASPVATPPSSAAAPVASPVSVPLASPVTATTLPLPTPPPTAGTAAVQNPVASTPPMTTEAAQPSTTPVPQPLPDKSPMTL